MTLRRLPAVLLWSSLAAIAALTAWGYAEAQRDPVVVRYAVGLGRWPAGQPPLRIVQLSDIHVAWPAMPLTRVERIVDQVNALHPDLVVLTGDYLGGMLYDVPVANGDQMLVPLRRLRARYGVIAVRGNHDSAYWTPIVFGRTQIAMLQNRWIAAGPVTVAGVDDITGVDDPAAAARQAVLDAPRDRPLILLAHEPDYFEVLPPGVDLLIAGHTHGGQIVLPFLGTRSTGVPFEDRHLRGHFTEHGRQLIVSSGIGTSLIPIRIGVPPEVALITLGPAAYSVGRNSGTDR